MAEWTKTRAVPNPFLVTALPLVSWDVDSLKSSEALTRKYLNPILLADWKIFSYFYFYLSIVVNWEFSKGIQYNYVFWGWKLWWRLKDWPREERRDLTWNNYLSFQVFRQDFTLCLMLGDFLSDPILSDSPDLTLSIYGDKHQFRTTRLSSMHLHLAEGHVLGQVSGYSVLLAP